LLSENHGLAKIYKPGNVSVVFASPERMAALKKQGGSDRQLEYWSPEESGSKDFQRPTGHDGKHVLEIYSPELRNNPEKLKQAIYGDLLHGMSKDPYFASLRKQFTENYPPKIAEFNAKIQKERGVSKNSIDDMYIRGRLAEGQGDEWKSTDRYSPKQLEIIEKMKRYLSTGKSAE
jgi:hypothetical protein